MSSAFLAKVKKIYKGEWPWLKVVIKYSMINNLG